MMCSAPRRFNRLAARSRRRDRRRDPLP
jgi:hypothetical protein